MRESHEEQSDIRTPFVSGDPEDASLAVYVFDTIWNRLEIGILLLDLVDKTIVAQNPAGIALLRDVAPRLDYPTVQALFLDPEGGSDPGASRGTRVVRQGHRVLGFTVYRTAMRHCVVLLRDITNQVRLEAIAEAANLMENIGYVFAGIRHELGNPVNSVKIALSVLRRDVHEFSKEKIIEYLDRSLAEVARVEYLLASLRNFGMYESVRCEAIELPRFVAGFVRIVEREISARGAVIDQHLGCGEVWISADPRALHQVLLNLMTNAVDALAGKAGARIDIDVEASGDLVLLRVSDNGCGMSGAQLADLFKPFSTSKPNGTGLGLVIAKKMLAAMQGQIDVVSREREGTAVTITLPRARPGAQAVRHRIEDEARDAKPGVEGDP